jgi:hypothetical protein
MGRIINPLGDKMGEKLYLLGLITLIFSLIVVGVV